MSSAASTARSSSSCSTTAGCWPRDEFAAAVRVERSLLDSALERLQAAGVVVSDAEEVRASPCARFIDALELIGI